MSKSVRRVEQAARDAGVRIEILRMEKTTRTARDAAEACGCTVAQIVKSLVFRRPDGLALFLVSGRNQVDIAHVSTVTGETFARADADEVRSATGFAIGGVAPIGHKSALRVWMDRDLMEHAIVWAAAGTPDSVFSVSPTALLEATGATLIQVRAAPQG